MRALAFCLALLAGASAARAAAPVGMEGLESAAEFRVTAECGPEGTQEHTRWWCFVDIAAGDLRIQSDEADYYDDRKKGGGRRVEARGNVVFILGDQRISGESFQMDLETGKGMLTKARGFVQPGVFLEADTLERVSGKQYIARGAEFTSCYQPSPRWSFTTAKAKFKLDDHVLAWGVNFRVKDYKTPLFLPVFYYPIQEDQRSTGFLFPSFGFNNYTGFTTGTGFFWAMSRSMDQTLQFDYMSKTQTGGRRISHEFRYLRRQPSGGTFRSEFFWPNGSSSRQYNLNWSGTQMLPLGIKATLAANEYSSTQHQRNYQQDFASFTTRSRNWRFALQRNLGRNSVEFRAERNDFFFPLFNVNQSIEEFERRQRLPSLVISRPSQRLGRTGIQWSYRASAEQLGLGDQNGTDVFSRYDFLPQISRPIVVSFLDVTPTLRLRYTRLGGRERSDDETTTEIDEGGFFHEPFERNWVEGSLEMRGPRFSRVFNNAGGFYSDRFKHVIGPEVGFVRRIVRTTLPPPPATDAVPPFDTEDLLPETTEVRYGLVQRLYAKRPGPSGKPITHEFLRWRVSQTYYAIEAASNFDPNYLSARFDPSFFIADPQKLSPIRSDLRFMPSEKFSTDFGTEYNTKFRAFQSVSVRGQLDLGRLAVNGSWSRSVQLTQNLARRRVRLNTLRGSGGLDIIPGKLRIDASAAYDYLNKFLLQRTVSLRYDVQCCGFFIEQRRYGGFGGVEPIKSINFQIQLANIGSVGNFGQEMGRGGLY